MASWDDDDYVPDLPTAPSLATSSSSAAGVGGDEDEDATLKELRATSSSSSTSSAPTSSSAPKASSSSSSNSGSKGGKSKSSHSSKKDNSEGAEGGICATCGRSGSEGVSSDHIPLLDPVAEKKRLEALMIKSEVAAAQALMGLTSTSSGAGGAGGGAAVHTPDMKSQVDAVSLLTSDSFRDFGKLVAQRVNEASGASKGGGALATRFYNELLLSGADKLGTHELAALAKVLDTIRNKKLQEERDKSKGASKSKKAAKVQVGGERHGVPMDDYDDDGDYGDYGTTAAGGGGGGASTSGNSGNVGMSLALAGLTVTPGVGSGGEGDGKFVRTKFNAEDDFM